jgi:3',5'-cyclic AMP phosphodiesterase CpdA
MRTVVHLSDLHFGRVDDAIVGPLTRHIVEMRPDVVTVSGDLTQRARSNEFREAQAFLKALPSPQIIVPGNHDVPLHQLITRFLRPLWKYRHYITDDLAPSFVDEEIAVLGVNTARSLTIKEGRVNARQIARLHERLCSLGDQVLKLIVSHHPFFVAAGYPASVLVGRARMARTCLATCGVDVYLAGHLHVGRTGQAAVYPDIQGHSAVVVQAGTSTSTRSRGAGNSFNVLRIERSALSVEKVAWHPQRRTFAVATTDRFRRIPTGWVPSAEEDARAIDTGEQ